MKEVHRHLQGPLTLVTSYGFGFCGLSTIREPFSSIDALACRISLSCLRPSRGSELIDTVGDAVDEYFWSEGRFRIHVVLGADGLPVDAWKVVADLRSHSKERAAWLRGCDRLTEARFRDGPIPLRNRWHSHYRGFYRRSGTFQETKAAESLRHDQDVLAVGLTVRGKRSRASIGDNDWEGIQSMRHKDGGWKRHRRTQWKSARP
jgi:hypothetical protein